MVGSYAANPLGQALAGPVALVAGVRPAVAVAAAAMALANLVVLASPAVRSLRRTEPPAYEPAGI